MGAKGSRSSEAPDDVGTVETKAIAGQTMGTSGLRKKTAVVEEKNYVENFVQAIMTGARTLHEGEFPDDATLVVSGDGRYYNKQVAHKIIQIARANGVRRVLVGKDFLMSTPCVSYIIRKEKALGAIILTASHNPGGKTEDFGIKFNTANGGPAPEKVTRAIEKIASEIKEYKIAREPVDEKLGSVIGKFEYGPMVIDVVDAPKLYADFMKTIFDFEAIRKLMARPDFSFVFDAMHGVAGPFAQSVFVDALGAPATSIIHGESKEDFGGHHPDPNLTYAPELIRLMGVDTKGATVEAKAGDDTKRPAFGAAADGDADRNMVLGAGIFVTPSDSLAIIVANAQASIPYFSAGLKGVARSMPTSGAVDLVAKKLKIDNFAEVPTGWKFFGNLMDAGKLSICGEESFGTGSDHIREKDGLWAVLAWLAIIAKRSTPEHLATVREIVEDHWLTYGRNYYTRYDYEGVTSEAGDALMTALRAEAKRISASTTPVALGEYTVKTADDFEYKDPVDGSVSSKQGIRFIFTDGSRIIFRLSGTGSSGATIRLYIEQYQAPAAGVEVPPASDVAGRAALLERSGLGLQPPAALAKLIVVALGLLNQGGIQREPTVIT